MKSAILAFLLLLPFSSSFVPPTRNSKNVDFNSFPVHEGMYSYLPEHNYTAGAANRIKRSGSATSNNSCGWVRNVPASIRKEFGLNKFYTRYTEAYGIPVVSSPGVPDTSLQRACYITRFLFADIYDARNAYYSWFGRIAVIGKNVRTTQLPEFSFLAPWWDQRARGFGATEQAPVSCCEEENLLCYSNDKWRNQDIGIHEFAHGLHILGLSYVPRLKFQSKLVATYNSARSRGLWTNTYASTDPREYWAEGVTTYFNVQAYSARPDGIHNSISTREKLQKYDPQLYNLIKSAFPCGNTYIKRCKDTSQTKSLSQQLKINSPKCTLESKGKFTNKPGQTTKKPTSSCVDKNKSCDAWSRSGYCKSPSYVAYMKANCKKSCHIC